MPASRFRSARSRETFVVRILKTDDDDWTGVIRHVQSGRERAFRRFIEAVRFIDEFVSKRRNDEGAGSRKCEGVAHADEARG